MEVYDLVPRRNPFAYWVRDRIEADEELKNISANDLLMKRRISGITLSGRLDFEAKYFIETGNHLDKSNITYCTGSCYSVGGVPSVGFGSDGRVVGVGWYDPDYSDSDLRSRETVV